MIAHIKSLDTEFVSFQEFRAEIAVFTPEAIAAAHMEHTAAAAGFAIDDYAPLQPVSFTLLEGGRCAAFVFKEVDAMIGEILTVGTVHIVAVNVVDGEETE